MLCYASPGTFIFFFFFTQKPLHTEKLSPFKGKRGRKILSTRAVLQDEIKTMLHKQKQLDVISVRPIKMLFSG